MPSSRTPVRPPQSRCRQSTQFCHLINDLFPDLAPKSQGAVGGTNPSKHRSSCYSNWCGRGPAALTGACGGCPGRGASPGPFGHSSLERKQPSERDFLSFPREQRAREGAQGCVGLRPQGGLDGAPLSNGSPAPHTDTPKKATGNTLAVQPPRVTGPAVGYRGTGGASTWGARSGHWGSRTPGRAVTPPALIPLGCMRGGPKKGPSGWAPGRAWRPAHQPWSTLSMAGTNENATNGKKEKRKRNKKRENARRERQKTQTSPGSKEETAPFIEALQKSQHVSTEAFPTGAKSA